MGIPISRVGESQGTAQRPRAEGNAQFSRLWGLLSHSPLGAGEAELARRLKGEPTPQTPPRRARRGNDFHWTLGGLFSRNAPSGAGRGSEDFFLCRCFSRDKGGAIPTGQGPSRPDREKAFNPPPDRAQKKKKRASRGRSPQTVIKDNPLPTTNDDRRHPAEVVSRRMPQGK